MLAFLVNIINAFIPVALLTGMLAALWPAVNERKAGRPLAGALAFGVLGGGILFFVSLRHETLTAARTFLDATGILAALLNGGIFLLAAKRGREAAFIGRGTALLFTALLAAIAAFSFLTVVTEQALSAISVLNTELILNIGGILVGAFLIAFLVPLTAHLGEKSARKIVSALLLFVSLLLVAQWSAEALLGLMRLEMAEITSLRLSFVAKVGKYSSAFSYVHALIIMALAIAFFIRRPAAAAHELAPMGKAERRKARSRVIFEMRWFRSAIASVVFIAAILLYHDLYAARPPKISPPQYLTPDAAGLIKIRIAEVTDGNLHRYAYVADDGHVIRFFLINRSRGLAKIGVVYDACMLCGDMGYLQEKNEVICIACNVRIFVPSIGKAGGCNPIPLTHQVEGEEVVISIQDLDKGARYFSQVVSKKVKDPVTGKELESSKAPFRYEYQGRTYFFESEQSAEKFKQSPEKFIGGQEARYYRVQGYKET